MKLSRSFLSLLTTQTHLIIPGIDLKYKGSKRIERFTFVSVVVRVAVVVCMTFNAKKQGKEKEGEKRKMFSRLESSFSVNRCQVLFCGIFARVLDFIGKLRENEYFVAGSCDQIVYGILVRFILKFMTFFLFF